MRERERERERERTVCAVECWWATRLYVTIIAMRVHAPIGAVLVECKR